MTVIFSECYYALLKFCYSYLECHNLYFRTGEEETKVQVDSTNSEGYTALHYACWQGHQKVARLLKEAKADPRARYE